MEPRLEALDRAEVERQEVEKEGSVRLGGERDELALRGGVRAVVNVLEVGRLPAQARPVIDDLAVDLARRVIDEGHRSDVTARSGPSALLREQAVDVVVRDLGEGRVEVGCQDLFVLLGLAGDLLENLLELRHGPAHP